jgi:hypothetical protein
MLSSYVPEEDFGPHLSQTFFVQPAPGFQVVVGVARESRLVSLPSSLFILIPFFDEVDRFVPEVERRELVRDISSNLRLTSRVP